MEKLIQTLREGIILNPKNCLFLNDLTPDSDTIKTVVSRNGEIEKIVRLENGREIELNNSILDSLTEKQRENLTEY